MTLGKTCTKQPRFSQRIKREDTRFVELVHGVFHTPRVLSAPWCLLICHVQKQKDDESASTPQRKY